MSYTLLHEHSSSICSASETVCLYVVLYVLTHTLIHIHFGQISVCVCVFFHNIGKMLYAQYNFAWFRVGSPFGSMSSLLLILFHFFFFRYVWVWVTHRFHKLNCLLQFGKGQMKIVSKTTEQLQWVQAGRVSVRAFSVEKERQMERVTIVFVCWFLHIAFVVRLFFRFNTVKKCAFGRCSMHPILTCRRNIY